MENILNFCNISGTSVKNFEGTRKYIATGDIIDNKIRSYGTVTYNNRPSRANQNVKIGDIIFAKMQNTIKVLKIENDNVNNIYSTGFYVIEPKKDVVTTDFLYWLFNSLSFNKQKDKNCNGATQRALNNDGLAKIQIKYLPNLQEQNYIVQTLNKLNDIIELKKEEIKQFDELIKSQFVENAIFNRLEVA